MCTSYLYETKVNWLQGSSQKCHDKIRNNYFHNLTKSSTAHCQTKQIEIVPLGTSDKHIEIIHHFIMDHFEKRDCIIEFVFSPNQISNTFTIPFPKEILFFIRVELRILNQSCMDYFAKCFFFFFFLFHFSTYCTCSMYYFSKFSYLIIVKREKYTLKKNKVYSLYLWWEV